MKCIPMKKHNGELTECNPSEATHLRIHICDQTHPLDLPVQIGGTRRGTNNWSWNGDVDRPTLKPSVKTTYGLGKVCHTWVNDGLAQHLSDCTCGKANTTQELIDIPSKERE